MKERISSNLVDYDSFKNDNFDVYFIDRAKKIVRIIEKAMGKPIPDKASEQMIKLFGEALVNS